MRSQRLVVFEQHGRWAAWLRRWLPELADLMHECRSLGEAAEALEQQPSSFAVVEVRTENLDRALDWLAESGRRHPACRLGCVGSAEIRPYGDLLREAGALFVACSACELRTAAVLIARSLPPDGEPHDLPAWVARALPAIAWFGEPRS